jgi:hypothetical protein
MHQYQIVHDREN